jgi:nitrogen regulatory protein P-II 2
MHTVRLKLVTIVAEPVLEPRLVPELHALGATGHTVTESRGEGSRAMRASEIPGDGRRIEVVVTDAVADRILAHLAEHYFPRYAVIAYLTDVEVLRGEKYVK